MTPGSSAIVTVAFGHSTEHLDYTFLSFAQKNPGVPLHAFVIGNRLPEKREPQITYHLVPPVPDFSHPLREVYFRRHELIDQLDVEFVLVVDSYDVLCLQSLPPLEKILAGFDMAAATEHMGSRYVLGQGYTSNFLNGGVTFWNVPKSRDIRAEIGTRGRGHFRTVADDGNAVIPRAEQLQRKISDARAGDCGLAITSQVSWSDPSRYLSDRWLPSRSNSPRTDRAGTGGSRSPSRSSNRSTSNREPG